MRSRRLKEAPHGRRIQRWTARTADLAPLAGSAPAVFSVMGSCHGRLRGRMRGALSNFLRAESEFAVQGIESGLHISLGDDEGNIALGGALRDGDDVHIGASKSAEGAAGDAWNAAHVLANDSDYGDRGIERDVLDFFVGHVARKFLAKCVDGALRVGGSD